MKTIVELTSADMAEIIAKHFGVSTDDVTITPHIAIEGFGMMEHEVTKVECKVEINKEVRRCSNE